MRQVLWFQISRVGTGSAERIRKVRSEAVDFGKSDFDSGGCVGTIDTLPGEVDRGCGRNVVVILDVASERRTVCQSSGMQSVENHVSA